MATDNMMNIGDFCWAELLATDINKSTEFYTQLFGWGKDTTPLSENETYTMYTVNNSSIAGGMQINAQMKAMQVPAHWNAYVLVQDINASVKKAQELGAKIAKDVSDVLDMGKMAVIIDPTGAAFSLWQSVKNTEGEALSKSIPGNIGWYELITNDTEKAGKFYTTLFNWTVETMKKSSGELYTTFINEGKPVAGMLKPDKEDRLGTRWGIYVAVKNLDETLNKAKKLGGSICYEPIAIPDVGRFTMIRDPYGVFFSIIEFSQTM